MTTQTRTYQCFCCNHSPFNSPKELAQHISSQKKGHRKSKMWAAKVLAGSTLRNKVERKPVSKDPDKVATEYGDDNRENAKLQLSGQLHGIYCICPHCRQPHHKQVEVEFLILQHL